MDYFNKEFFKKKKKKNCLQFYIYIYIPFSSSHPAHCKRAIPYGVALRVRRNCSTDEFLNQRCDEYKGYLKFQGYHADLVDTQFDRAINNERSELLKKKVKPDKKV